MEIQIDPILLGKISKPTRYTGGEWNSVVKPHNTVQTSFALAFPDVYEVGMSHIGLKILYSIINDRPDAVAERVYTPWPDMEQLMREHQYPLFSLETKTAIKKFDMLGFTLQYEMSYTNILTMLDLAEIPLYSKDRDETVSLVVVGGPCAYNAEALADFVDVVMLGEAEDSILEMVDTYSCWKNAGRPGGRKQLLREMAKIEGNYIPSFYDVQYDKNGQFESILPNEPNLPAHLRKRVIADLDRAPYPTKFIVPYLGIVHDRTVLELFRGCTRGCRFCQAGMIYRPVRERKPETLVKLAKEIIDSAGYDEISLMSLSSADYSHLDELVDQLMATFEGQQVSISLPSLRVDSFSVSLAKKVQQIRKSGLTFAPEAGTQRLRDVINKGVTEDDLMDACANAFRNGWSTVKLYFMMGLPTETDEDLAGIADLAYKVVKLYKNITRKSNIKVTVSVASFVPKPYTAFQWFGQNSVAEIERKQRYLKSLIRDKHISYHYHDGHTGFVEAVFARGDRRLGDVLVAAWQLGAKFDGWGEFFDYTIWEQAFQKAHIDPNEYATRERSKTEALPWDHIEPGVSKRYLIREWDRCERGEITNDCRHLPCGGCGVCSDLDVQIVDLKEEATDGKTTFSY